MRGPTVCVINYNGESYLERSLAALMEDDSPRAGIVLVDNGSTDGSRALVESRFPDVKIIELGKNLGPAAARNRALAQASTELVVLIDNDVVVTPGALGKLVDALGRDPAAVTAMPAILYDRGDGTIQYDGADTHFLGHQSLHHEGVAYGTTPLDGRELGSVVSACIVVDRSRLPVLGTGGDGPAAFDEDFFIYFEDHDFGHRMRMAGLRVLAVPAAVCYHGVGTPDLSIRALGSYSPLRVFCHIRNRWLFIIKNYSAQTLLLLAPVLVFYEFVQLGGVVRKGWLREWTRAAWWIVSHARNLMRKRREAQRTRQVPDRALLVGGPVPLKAEATTTPLEAAARRLMDTVAGGYWRVVREVV